MKIIIVSENRACQVQLLVDTLLKYHHYTDDTDQPGSIDISIIFNATGNHLTGYRILRENLPDYVTFEQTTSVKRAIIAHIQSSNKEHVVLLTDNMVFTRKFNIQHCIEALQSNRLKLLSNCFSLINGQNVCVDGDNIYNCQNLDYFKPYVTYEVEQNCDLYTAAPVGYIYNKNDIRDHIESIDFSNIQQLIENTKLNVDQIAMFPISVCSICTYNKVDNIDVYKNATNKHQYNIEALNTRYLLGYKIDEKLYDNLISNQLYQDTEPVFNLFLDSIDASSISQKPFTFSSGNQPEVSPLRISSAISEDIAEENISTDTVLFNEHFPVCHYINLDERRDRDDTVKDQFTKHDLSVYRWQATTLTEEESTSITNDGALKSHALNVPAQQACALSHLDLITHARNNDYDNIFIFEDDVVLHDDFNKLFDASLHDLLNHDPEWDMFFLGSNPVGPIKRITENLGQLTNAHCAHAYAVNKHFYDTILEFSFTRSVCTDAWYNDLMRSHKCYTSLPNITWQCEGFSDLCGFNVNYKPEMDEKYKPDNMIV